MDFPAEIPAAGTVAAVIIFDPPICGVPEKFGLANGAFAANNGSNPRLVLAVVADAKSERLRDR